MRRIRAIGISLIFGIAIGVVGFAVLSHIKSRSTAVMTTMPSADGGEQRQALWTCAMHPQVIADHPGDCPICHMKLVPMRSDDAAADASGKRKVLYWWDPMLGPSSIADKPGKSAMGMDRIPVYADEASAGPAVTVDPAVEQNMGVRTTAVRRGPLTNDVRAVGILKVPEPRMRDISLKVSGWIDTLQADTEGMHVEAGEPLFTMYSPDVVVAEDELIAAERADKALPADAADALREQTQSLVRSAREKLRLWDIAQGEIDAIAKAQSASRTVVIRSPISGHVIDKSVVAGSAVTAGMKVMRIENHSQLWLDAEVYANDFEGARVGQTMNASIEGLPGKAFTGTISFIYPHVDHMARTLMVRATFDNPDMTLRPGMFATAKILSRTVEDAVLAPRDAIIDTGSEQIAFVASGNGHFEPRRLTVGRHGENDVEVLTGLAPGEAVVTSGQFLLDVESNTKAAIARLRGSDTATEQAKPMSDSMPMPTTAPMSAPVPTGMSMPATTPATQQLMSLTVLHCPMKNADWLQTGDETHNPYFGTAMESCGSVTAHLPRADDPQLKTVVDGYLKIANELSQDQFSADSAAALKAAVDRVDAVKAKSLRSSVDALTRSPDLAAARRAFQSVSADVITLLQGEQR